jgi:uncharacterized protein
MRLFKSSDYVRRPWKNGGGMMADIAVAPGGAGLDAFEWRISLAHVGVSGPFSVFPGIDRSMVILSGSGMRLDIAGQPAVTLGVASPALAFPGDAATAATLTAGPVEDLNIMTRRGRYVHSLQRLQFEGHYDVQPTPGGVVAIYVESHIVHASSGDGQSIARAGDTIIFDAAGVIDAAMSTRICRIVINRAAE